MARGPDWIHLDGVGRARLRQPLAAFAHCHNLTLLQVQVEVILARLSA
jgi:hypothetical protein